MFGIGQFFKRIQGSFAKEIVIREIVSAAINKHTGVAVPITSISFKSNTVLLSGVSTSLKSAIYIKKQSILREISSMQDVRPIADIR